MCPTPLDCAHRTHRHHTGAGARRCSNDGQEPSARSSKECPSTFRGCPCGALLGPNRAGHPRFSSFPCNGLGTRPAPTDQATRPIWPLIVPPDRAHVRVDACWHHQVSRAALGPMVKPLASERVLDVSIDARRRPILCQTIRYPCCGGIKSAAAPTTTKSMRFPLFQRIPGVFAAGRPVKLWHVCTSHAATEPSPRRLPCNQGGDGRERVIPNSDVWFWGAPSK